MLITFHQLIQRPLRMSLNESNQECETSRPTLMIPDLQVLACCHPNLPCTDHHLRRLLYHKGQMPQDKFICQQALSYRRHKTVNLIQVFPEIQLFAPVETKKPSTRAMKFISLKSPNLQTKYPEVCITKGIKSKKILTMMQRRARKKDRMSMKNHPTMILSWMKRKSQKEYRQGCQLLRTFYVVRALVLGKRHKMRTIWKVPVHLIQYLRLPRMSNGYHPVARKALEVAVKLCLHPKKSGIKVCSQSRLCILQVISRTSLRIWPTITCKVKLAKKILPHKGHPEPQRKLKMELLNGVSTSMRKEDMPNPQVRSEQRHHLTMLCSRNQILNEELSRRVQAERYQSMMNITPSTIAEPIR